MSDLELRFKIDAYSPKTIPMERLGEYLAALGAMLGETDDVHFERLVPGSTCILHRVEGEAAPKVEQRISELRTGTADVVHINAYKRINDLLKADNASGNLTREDGTGQVLVFPGKNALEPARPEVVVQPGTIDGIVIRLGGKDATVPVLVQDGSSTYKCTTTRELARSLGHHLFGRELRFMGEAKWMRHESGAWSLDHFTIADFIELDDTPLTDIVAQLRGMPGDWGTNGDAFDELRHMRDEGDEH